MPLWASYLVKVYSWRTMFAENGVINWFLEPFGLSVPESGYIARLDRHVATSGCRT